MTHRMTTMRKPLVVTTAPVMSYEAIIRIAMMDTSIQIDLETGISILTIALSKVVITVCKVRLRT